MIKTMDMFNYQSYNIETKERIEIDENNRVQDVLLKPI